MGSHLVELLHEAGYPVRATDLPAVFARDTRSPGRFPSVVKRLGVEVVPADLTDPPSLDPVVRDVKLVFHLAAIFNYSTPRAELQRVNVDGTRALVARLLAQPSFSKLVLWGAGGVYDLDAPIPYTEETPRRPGNDYLRSKADAEDLVMKAGREQGLRYSIVRPTTVYGPRGGYGGGQMILGAARAPVATCPRNWDFRIPFVHAVDVCRAAVFLAENPRTDGQAYNLNDSSELTNVEFFRFVGEVTGKPFLPLPAVDPARLRRFLVPVARGVQWACARLGVQPPLEADTVSYLGRDFTYANRKLLDTGFQLSYPDARHGIADTILWYQRNGWL
jgi:nucleoside-diphosphate-sugar epimerase